MAGTTARVSAASTKTGATRNFFIQCSWEVEKIETVGKTLTTGNRFNSLAAELEHNRSAGHVFPAVMWGL